MIQWQCPPIVKSRIWSVLQCVRIIIDSVDPLTSFYAFSHSPFFLFFHLPALTNSINLELKNPLLIPRRNPEHFYMMNFHGCYNGLYLNLLQNNFIVAFNFVEPPWKYKKSNFSISFTIIEFACTAFTKDKLFL